MYIFSGFITKYIRRIEMKKIIAVLMALFMFMGVVSAEPVIKKTTIVVKSNTNNFDVQKFIDSQDLSKFEWEDSTFEEMWEYQFEWAKDGRNYPMWKGKNFISKTVWLEDYLVLKVIMILEE